MAKTTLTKESTQIGLPYSFRALVHCPHGREHGGREDSYGA